METNKMDLQLFNGMMGPAPSEGSVNQGSQSVNSNVSTGQEGGQTQYTPQVGQQVQGQQNVGGPRPEGHQIRSILTSAEQTWRENNSHLFDIEAILREQGYDPRQVATEYRRAQQEAARQAQMGGVDPRLAQYLTGLEAQMGQLQNFIHGQQRQDAVKRIGEAEAENAELGKKFGINYDKQVRDTVRMHAARTGLTVQAAFKELYFEQMMQLGARQAQGDTILQLQGRGQQGQPVSSAVPGSGQQGPIDWRTVSREDFYKARDTFRNSR